MAVWRICRSFKSLFIKSGRKNSVRKLSDAQVTGLGRIILDNVKTPCSTRVKALCIDFLGRKKIHVVSDKTTGEPVYVFDNDSYANEFLRQLVG